MPIYEYRCLKCGHQFERMQKIADKPVSHCEKCKERVTRVFHPVAIHFKGSGFYTTDYAKKRSTPAQPTGEKSGGKSGDNTGKKQAKDKQSQGSRNSQKKAAAGSKDS